MRTPPKILCGAVVLCTCACVGPRLGKSAIGMRIQCYPKIVAQGDEAVWTAADVPAESSGVTSDYWALAKIDRRTGRILQVKDMGRSLLNHPVLTVGLGALWYAGGSVVQKIDPASGAEIFSVALKNANFDGLDGIAVGYDAVWVTRVQLVRLDPATGEVVAIVPVRGKAGQIAIGDGDVWVVTETGVSRVDSRRNVEIAWIPLKLGGNRRIVFGASNVWVFDSRGRLTRIDPRTNQIAIGPGVGSVEHVIPIGDKAVWILEKRPSTAGYRLIAFDPVTNGTGQEQPLDEWKSYEALPPATAEHAVWLCVDGRLRRIPLPN